MKNKDRVIELINDKRETSHVDFKRDFYKKLVGSDFPKDICAFANLHSDKDRYIIFGVEDKSREIYGVDPKTIASTDTLDNYINKTIDPFVGIESDLFEYQGKYVAYIKISAANDNPPYMIKKTCGPRGKLEKGDIFIRKGTCNQKAERMDLDLMYNTNGSCTVRLFDNDILVEDTDDPAKHTFNCTAKLEIENKKNRPLLIRGGSIRLTIGQANINRKLISIDKSPMEIDETSRKLYTVHFPVTLSDFKRLNLNASSLKRIPTTAEIALYDTDKCKYVSEKLTARLALATDLSEILK